MKTLWMKYFSKEIEKTSGLPIMPLAMAAMSVSDVKNTAKQNIQKVQMQPLKQQEQSLQLPGSNSFQFEGSKRIDSNANSAVDKY